MAAFMRVLLVSRGGYSQGPRLHPVGEAGWGRVWSRARVSAYSRRYTGSSSAYAATASGRGRTTPSVTASAEAASCSDPVAPVAVSATAAAPSALTSLDA